MRRLRSLLVVLVIGGTALAGPEEVSTASPDDDAALVYSTFFGVGGNGGSITDVAATSAGEAVVVGRTHGNELPQARDIGPTGDEDAFVAKFAPTGTPLWVVQIGGSDGEDARSVALGPGGSIVVAGQTSSSDFPTLDAVQSYRGASDVFVLRLAADGTLEMSTVMGGASNENVYGVAVDASGDVYATGPTVSSDFSFSDPGSMPDGFVLRLPRDGTPAKTVPVPAGRQASDIAVTGDSVVLVGHNVGTVADAVVLWLDAADLSAAGELVVGGSRDDDAWRVHTDPDGTLYVIGTTSSADFPIVNAVQGPTPHVSPNRDVFLVRIDPGPTPTIGFSTYLGGDGTERAAGVSGAGRGRIAAWGFTNSSEVPAPGGAIADGSAGKAFVTTVDTTAATIRSTVLLGGSGDDEPAGVDVGRLGDAYVVGTTRSNDFPLANSFQSSRIGDWSPFVARVAYDYADLAVSAAATPEPVVAGGSLTLAVRVANAGTHWSTGVRAAVTLSRTVDAMTAPDACTGTETTVSCDLASIAMGGEVSLSFTVRPADVTAPTALTATVTVQADQGDPRPQDNVAHVSATVLPDADHDGVADSTDNCPQLANSSQVDLDADGKGDPCDLDDDGDQLTDTDELMRGTDPRNADTDGDGLTDGPEVADGIDPLDPDTDGDLHADGTELAEGSDPNNPFSIPGLVAWPNDVDPPLRELPVLDDFPPVR